ncbi:hypothetical protein NC991_15905 [Funiculus sociatus GB1-A4]|nr:hypothetical protein [Trichocoleus sp. FACHB-40]
MNFNRRIYLFSLASARLMEWKKLSRKCLLVSAAWTSLLIMLAVLRHLTVAHLP